MSAPKRYDPQTAEPRLVAAWEESGVYRFDPESDRPVFSIDTPPPTASGFLHLGHVYSYSHIDFFARFRRMNGYNVFYPMGYDDNGLPTDRLMERWEGVTAEEMGREAYARRCIEIGAEVEQGYERLWKRLGHSVDWRYTYRTIGDEARFTAQWSFLDLYKKGLAYRRRAPTIWCPTCHTAIAQAEVNDLERDSEYVTVPFHFDDGSALQIATTRPELLPACVAVFVHPDDERYAEIVGREATVPLFGQRVPVLADPAAEQDKGTGAVMCCTFGDVTDVEWWRLHHLPLREVLGRDGRFTEPAGSLAGMTIDEARTWVIRSLEEEGLLVERTPVRQSVRVHERCDTPVEFILTEQWFVRVLDHKDAFLAAGEAISWYPAHMGTRYREWVQNLHWDWAISRQRAFGVHFPVWFCGDCGAIVLADEDQLPVNPTHAEPPRPCHCGSSNLEPETDVMDTWATSSLSPQIAGRWSTEPELYARIFPMSLRPQAHDIIRTWAFYTVVQSHYHWDAVPWGDVVISGWGVAGQGSGKISKSRGGGPMDPMEAVERLSADALRYWAASTGTGKDAVISEEKIAAGGKVATKLWNVAGFSRRFLDGYSPPATVPQLSPSDRWLLSRLQRLIGTVTDAFERYDYAAAKNETESFFWRDLADNYLEMAKKRLYDGDGERHEAARYTLHHVLLTTLKLFAPILPFVTDAIYQDIFAHEEGSIHATEWPVVDPALLDGEAEEAGRALLAVAHAVRSYKSERNLSLGSELGSLFIAVDGQLAEALRAAEDDLSSVTRARSITVGPDLNGNGERLSTDAGIEIGVTPARP